jgi:hypothetical protein
MMMLADWSTRLRSVGVRTRAVLERGGRLIIVGSTGSTPRDWAGGPSMRMSRMWSVDAGRVMLYFARRTY